MKKLIYLMISVLLVAVLAYGGAFAHATKVGVLDQPVWCNHAEFKNCESYWMPQYGDTYLSHHGTAVASIIAGKNVGVSPNAELITFDLFYMPNGPWDGYWIGDEVDSGGMTIEQSAIWFAKQLGVTVFNQSYGDPSGVVHQDQINIWNANQDVLFVNAAGNNGRVVPPAAIGGNVILVGSVDKNNVRTPWSNIPGHGNKYHFIMAPGVDVLAAAAFWPDGGYIHATGTSFSAPIVTGAVAELQDRYPQLRNNPAGTKNALLTTATDLGPRGVHATYGWGLLNLPRAILQMGVNTYKAPVVNNDVPYIEVEAGRQEFAFQFIPNEHGELGIPNMRYYWTPELSLGYLYTDHTYSPSLNYSKAGLSLTMAYTKVDDQPDVYYSSLLGASANYFKSFEMTKKSDLELTATIPMFTVKGYASMDDEKVSYVQDPNYQLWLRWKGTF